MRFEKLVVIPYVRGTSVKIRIVAKYGTASYSRNTISKLIGKTSGGVIRFLENAELKNIQVLSAVFGINIPYQICEKPHKNSL